MLLQDFRLKVFVTVAEEKSFTKAASRLGISQPAVSQNIAELEKVLGVRLFDRQKGENTLTPEGEVFMKYARKSLELSASAQTVFATLPAATIRIGASDDLYTYYIAPRLKDFSDVHPEISFERSGSGDADLVIIMRPSAGIPFDIDPEVIAKVRMSLSRPSMKMGDIAAAHEDTSCFEIVFRPTPEFSSSRVCHVLKDYFASLL
ncbi:MAG: LysR family transcriptional regulator [Bacteroidales bacterium]|nr:LysR family transcriptional regulator [Bacteroidales bacterium]